MMDIYFYYPSHNVGGVQILFLRLATFIHYKGLHNVTLIDYEDGFIRNKAPVDLQVITPGEFRKIDFSDFSALVAPLSMLSKFEFENSNLHILYWCFHPRNLIDVLLGAQRLRNLKFFYSGIVKAINFRLYVSIKKALKEAILDNRVYFMDGPTYKATAEFYSLPQNFPAKKFLPIPIDDEYSSVRGQVYNPKKVLCLGRISVEKVNSLKFVFESLNNMEYDEIEVYVIGDGDFLQELDFCAYNNIKIHHQSDIDIASLPEFIREKEIGLSVGMGTSLMESAKCSVPSLLVDPSFTSVSKDYCPRWLCDVVDYDLGSFNREIGEGKKFYQFYKELINSKDNSIGQRCNQYVKEKHSMDSVVGKLEEALLRIVGGE